MSGAFRRGVSLYQVHMSIKLFQFIVDQSESILEDWETFAKSLGPAAATMSPEELRDHAAQILLAIAADMQTNQSAAEQTSKSKGHKEDSGGGSAAKSHGTLREASGFSLVQLTAEFRALRASVLRLWRPQVKNFSEEAFEEIVRFNEAMDQALAESLATFAHHSQRTQDTFLAILGHDLRGPLATMNSAGAYLVQPSVGTDGTLRMGQRVKRSAATMTAMVNDLLEFSRSQLGQKMPLRLAPADLQVICEVAMQDANAVHPDCMFKLTAFGDTKGTVDAHRLQQVATNLMSNAAQYGTRKTPVMVTVIGEPDMLKLRVKNDGPVIPPRALATIFDPLVQLPPDNQASGPLSTSMGLGLYIAEQIVLAHGGTIGVTSDASEGTIFAFDIPRQG